MPTSCVLFAGAVQVVSVSCGVRLLRINRYRDL